ncbi:Hypothetical predicted protein [Octopus vulgaris]|uniref:Target of rapamycin complex 2 subunit MAPKAP1 n=2 Tax=Octopus vulgaris TaxID=6645 RepID=A0AA36BXD9_OCTVU|nr:Hypothetical predicted protein [Octopus vulgaris]
MAMMDDYVFLISHIRNSFITSDNTGMYEMIIEGEEQEKAQEKRPLWWNAEGDSGGGGGGGGGESSGGGRGTPSSSSTTTTTTTSTTTPTAATAATTTTTTARYIHSNHDGGVDGCLFDLDDGGDLCRSYDIMPDMDYGAHRRRSNTAQRLERMKKEKRKQVKVTHISWRTTPGHFNPDDDHDDMFEKKPIPLPTKTSLHKAASSLLAQQLQTSTGIMSNPFLDYAKYDGKAQIVVPTKKIDIFLTMALPKDRGFPMHVVVVVNAKVHELIGLICWQYTNEGREPALKDNASMYSLHIAEDDGEVDMDFPSLDNREPVSKFGFSKLALVELEEPSPPMKNSVIITVNVPNRGFHKFQEEDLTKPLRDILTKVLKKRKIKLLPGMNYILEKQKEPGVSVDLDTLLSNLDNFDFCLVREHSTRGEIEEIDFQDSNDMATTFMSPQYKSYIVNLVQRLRINTEVHLGVSGEKVEIDPVASKGTALFFRQKAVTYEADMIAACDLLEEKSNGKSIFRLICFAGHDYRHYDFEADHAVAKEIIQKVNNILNLLLSQVRKTYLASRGKKLKKMHSK